jgi:hypothetical protein
MASRPTVAVWMENVVATPIIGLVDTGALRTRFPRELADTAGVDLTAALSERIAIAGIAMTAWSSRVSMRLGEGQQAHHWDCAVWFCEPWPFDFALLGLEGFLQHFRVTMSAYHGWVDCVPET